MAYKVFAKDGKNLKMITPSDIEVGGEALETVINRIDADLEDKVSKSETLASAGWRSRNFVHELKPIHGFSLPVRYVGDLRFFLQGFTTDNDDTLWYCQDASDHTVQYITKYSFSTGESTSVSFTNLGHVNDATYGNGKLYIATMAFDNSSELAIVDAETLTLEKLINYKEGIATISYDVDTDRLYSIGNGKLRTFKTDLTLEREIKLQWRSTDPATLQGMCTWNGFVFLAKSSVDTRLANNAAESVTIFDIESGEYMGQWFFSTALGEVETLAIYKDALLIGTNDGPAQIQFYFADFCTIGKAVTLRPASRTSLLEHTVGYLGQEILSIYVDASAKFDGAGTAASPLRSLESALRLIVNAGAEYRANIYVAGDLRTENSKFIQGHSRVITIVQWSGKTAAILPAIRIFDAKVKFDNITIIDNSPVYTGRYCPIYAENSDVTIQNCTLQAGENTTNYIFTNKGQLLVEAIKFTGSPSALDTVSLTCNGGQLYIRGTINDFSFPSNFSGVRFYVEGFVSLRYSDTAPSVYTNMYIGSKFGSILHYDGTGSGTVSTL